MTKESVVVREEGETRKVLEGVAAAGGRWEQAKHGRGEQNTQAPPTPRPGAPTWAAKLNRRPQESTRASEQLRNPKKQGGASGQNKLNDAGGCAVEGGNDKKEREDG